MKTTKLFAALGMAAALFTGCSSEESTTDQGTTPNGITVGVEYDTDSVTRVTPATESVAVYDEEKGGVPVNLFDPQWSAQGADTRMTHDDGTNKFLWEGTDKLGLLYTSSSASSLYTVDYLDLKSGATTNEAKFFRMLNLTFWGDPNAAATYYFLPFYPYETKYGATTWNGTAGDATTKQYIDADQGDGTGWKNYAFATANALTIVPSITSDTKKITLTSGDLKHKNTYVKFTVRSGNGKYKDKSVKSIKIEAPSTIAGTCWLGFSGSPSWVSGTESTSVTLSNAGAFQGTIQTTCTNLGNYKYNTAYSAQGSMMVIKAGSFKPVITVTLTDNTELQRTMANAIDFKAGYLRIVNLNLDDFTNTAGYTMKFVSSNTTYGTVNQPYKYTGSGTVTTSTEGLGGNGYNAKTADTDVYALAGVSPATGYRLDSWTTPGGTVIKVKWQNTTSNATEKYQVSKVDESGGELIGGGLIANIAYYDGKTWTANFRPFAKVVSSDISKGTVPTPTVEASALAEVWTITAGGRYYINSSSSSYTYGHVATPTPASGYTFTGWTVSGAAASANNGTFALGTLKSVDGLYTINTDGSIVTNTNATAGITFTANFATEAQSYEVEWVNGYGGSIRTDTKTWGTNLTSPDVPTRSGYFFKGWAISPSTTVTVAANTSCTDASFGKSSYSNAKVTMTAIWDAMCGITTETRTTSHGLGLHFTGYFPSSGYILISKGTNTAGTGELRFYPRGNSSYVELTFTPTLTGTTTTYQYPVGDEAKKYFFGETDVTSVETYSYTYDETSRFYDVYISELQSEFSEGKYCAGISLLCTNHAYFPAMVKRCMFTCFGYSVKDSSCY